MDDSDVLDISEVTEMVKVSESIIVCLIEKLRNDTLLNKIKWDASHEETESFIRYSTALSDMTYAFELICKSKYEIQLGIYDCVNGDDVIVWTSLDYDLAGLWDAVQASLKPLTVTFEVSEIISYLLRLP